MKEIATMAQDFVEATSALVGHRTINIMDTNAIIIASTEKNRIGTFHQGAAEVLATGKPVLVRKENLAAYPGAREGYNMPIYLEDEMIGVVGMFGDEAEVRDTANLLCVYVSVCTVPAGAKAENGIGDRHAAASLTHTGR